MTYQLREDDCTQDLIRGLTDDEIALLRTSVQALGSTGFLKYLDRHQSNMSRYLKASPAQRMKQRKAYSQEEGLLLLLGAIWLSQMGKVIHLDLQSPALAENRDGPKRRHARGMIGITLLHAVLTHQIGWPFANPNPFRN